MAVTLGNKPDKDVLAVCQARLKHSDTWRNRLLCAKALERLERFVEMNDQIHKSLQLAPLEIMPNLFKCAALLRTADDPQTLEEAHQYLKRADDALMKSFNIEYGKELALVAAIFNGLLGHVDAAVNQLRDIQKTTGDDPRIQDALKALGR
jgi:uncharacterized protein YicC (UPF0701 family)